jgi:hypothetical protein
MKPDYKQRQAFKLVLPLGLISTAHDGMENARFVELTKNQVEGI